MAVQVELEFFNLRHANATTAPPVRSEIPHAGPGATAPVRNIAYPNIFNVHTVNAANQPIAAGNRLHYGGPNGPFPVLHPGESVRFSWSLWGHANQSAHNRDGSGNLNRAYRINYDIIATQVDEVD